MESRSAVSDRQRTIIRALNGSEAVTVSALARLTGASAVTIRRDLTELSRKGLVTRIHGGALRAPKRGAEHPFVLRKSQDTEAKRVLAKTTARMIDDGESVILDNGTTCDLVAENLAGRDITVLALGLRAAVTMAEVPGVRVVVPGGAVETGSLAMLKSPVIDVVRDFRADVAILGACAASVTNGLTCVDPSDAELKRNILQSSTRAILPATPRKLTRSSVHRFGKFEDLSDLLTTADIPEESLSELRSSGVPITVCD